MSSLSEPSHFHLLRAISRGGALSRTELADLTGLSKASITNLTRDLISRGMLRETGIVYGSGRPSIKLGLDTSMAYFVGVSLLPQPVMLLADLHGTVHGDTRMHEWQAQSEPVEPVVIGRCIHDALPELAQSAGIPLQLVRGLGVAVPGFVDAGLQVCTRSTLLGWRNLAVARLIGEAAGIATVIENDANAVTTAEMLSATSTLRDRSSFCLVSVGEWISCGVVVDGAIHRGHQGGAGELAHVTIEPSGARCRCGKRGCLDTIASYTAIREAAAQAGLPTEIGELERQAGAGNAEAIRILHRAGSALGQAIATLIQLIDPQQVVIVNPQGPRFSLFETVTKQSIDTNLLPDMAERTLVLSRRVSSDVWAVGAARVAAHQYMFGEQGRPESVAS